MMIISGFVPSCNVVYRRSQRCTPKPWSAWRTPQEPTFVGIALFRVCMYIEQYVPFTWGIVKIMVPFGVPIIIRGLI